MTHVIDNRRTRLFFDSLLLITAVTCAVVMASTPASAYSESGFKTWVSSYKSQARRAGISDRVLDSAFSDISLDRKVIELANRQPEFVKPIWDYLDSAVSDRRIADGQAMLRDHRETLDAVEARYGVDRHIVVAIWGMESAYGQILDNPKIVRGTIRSLATLGYAGGKRSRYGRTQLMAALTILQNGDTAPRRMTGSWAGAMGHTQFIPTTYQAHAVDFDGDGRRDIWTTIPDALGSTANYLKVSGWETGKTWGYEVRLPRGFNYALADGRTSRTLSEWSRIGISRAHGQPFPRPSDAAVLKVPAGAKGPAFLMLKNFRVIKRYNNADAYALAVGHLADRIRGGKAFASDWPRHERPLTRIESVTLQRRLNAKGYKLGKADGKIGPKSREAIRSYQRANGLVADGFASSSLLNRIAK